MARPVFKRGLQTNAIKPSVGREEQPKMTDLVDMYDWGKDKEVKVVRAVGPVQSRGVHKINVKKKDGAEIQITKTCLKHNPETDEFDEDVECPYCDMPEGFQRRSKRYFVNVIDRVIEEDAPANFRVSPAEEKTGFKAMESKSWTPVRVLSAPSSFAERLLYLSGRNVVKNKQGQKKQFDFNDDRFGFDLDIGRNLKSKTPANMYTCDRNQDNGRFTPLDETQQGYLLWNIDEIQLPEELSVAKTEAKGLTDRWAKAKGIALGGDDSDDEEAEHMPRGRGAAAKKGARRPQQQESYGYEDGEDEGGGEDEYGAEESEELDLGDGGDEYGEDEGFEDEAPPPRRGPTAKKQAPAKKGAGRRAPEPEDEYGDEGDDGFGEDGGDEYGEEYEDTPPPRRGPPAKKAPAKKGARRPAPEPEEYGEDEGFEDEAPPPRRGPPAKKAPAKKGARRPEPAYEELEDLDDDIPF